MRALVSIILESTAESKKAYREYYGTSSETKPTADVATGSSFLEVDTGDVYLFDESNTEWVKQFSLQE